MPKQIVPTGPVHARISVPGSKSITNRALVCAALAEGDSHLANASDSDDTALLANGLNQLGILVRREGQMLEIMGKGGRLFPPKFPIPVGNAGTSLRFLLSLCSLADGRTVLEGSERMAERPNDDLLAALQDLGISARRLPPGTRFEVVGGTLRGGRVQVRGEKSSQFLSSILMLAPYAREDVLVSIGGRLASESYVDMTIGVMRAFGVEVAGSPATGFTVGAGRRYRPCTLHVEADASGASYPLAAAAIAGGEVVVSGLPPDSLQGDAAFAGLLAEMGCVIERRPDCVVARSSGALRGISIDMNRMPDVVPTLAAVALFAQGPSRIVNVGHLRYKESDRLGALSEELRKLGADVEVTADGLIIRPVPLHGADLDTHDDHRLAMSFALIGMKVPGITIANHECVRKSFPQFWEEFRKFSALNSM